MKKTTTILAGLMLCASVAMAQVSLTVGDCGAGSANHSITNACTLNTGAGFAVYGSIIVPSVTRTGFVGSMGLVDVATTATLPDWWRADACRSAGFTIAADAGIGGSCPTLWDIVAPAGSNLTGVYGLHGTNSERFLLGTVLASTDAYDLQGDGVTETSVFKWTILKSKSTGTGLCAGCATGACIVLNEVNLQTLTDTPATYVRLTTPIAAGSNIINYNTGGPVCGGTVPTTKHTWGSVKALYR